MRSMHHLIGVMPAILLYGSVDQINNNQAYVEITDSSSEVQRTHLPISLFPCKLKEGDQFYFIYIDEVTEVRCGEPPAE